jgi:microcystin-dependent protein
MPDLYLPTHLVPGPRRHEGIPVGTVVAFAGQVTPVSSQANAAWPNPSCQESGSSGDCNSQDCPVVLIETLGWMVCDGRALEPSKYPELFGTIGYLYGESDGNFKLPDYRGLFLRGVDSGAGMDPDAGSRQTPRGGRGSARGVGSAQCDALQNHVHPYEAVPVAATSEGGDAGGTPGTRQQTGEPLSPDGSTARTSLETRPRNMYVNYIIRYRS